MCGPKEYGFSAVLVINRVSISAILPPLELSQNTTATKISQLDHIHALHFELEISCKASANLVRGSIIKKIFFHLHLKRLLTLASIAS